MIKPKALTPYKIPKTAEDINYLVQESKKLFDATTRKKLFFNKNNADIVHIMNRKIGVIMTNKEILEKAIQKAIDGGWGFCDYSTINDKHRVFNRDYKVEDDGLYDKGPYACRECAKPDYTVYDIIFNHDFAKALWGEGKEMQAEEYVNTELYDIESVKASGRKYYEAGTDWQYHLQQMVISEDPIQYLKDNI